MNHSRRYLAIRSTVRAAVVLTVAFTLTWGATFFVGWVESL